MKNKLRVFIDMDGTIAEWQYGTAFESLYEPKYFRNLPPYQNMLWALRDFMMRHENDMEFFVLTAYFHDHPTARMEKKQWLDYWLPEIDDLHRVFVPCGEKKKDCVPDGIRDTDILLDDHTPNLLHWSGWGVKVLNGGNGKSGRWNGPKVNVLDDPKSILCQIEEAVQTYRSLLTLTDFGCACQVCGKELSVGEKVTVCCDCGAIFCKECTVNGASRKHNCEED